MLLLHTSCQLSLSDGPYPAPPKLVGGHFDALLSYDIEWSPQKRSIASTRSKLSPSAWVFRPMALLFLELFPFSFFFLIFECLKGGLWHLILLVTLLTVRCFAFFLLFLCFIDFKVEWNFIWCRIKWPNSEFYYPFQITNLLQMLKSYSIWLNKQMVPMLE